MLLSSAYSFKRRLKRLLKETFEELAFVSLK
jgi:hypothetical protein